MDLHDVIFEKYRALNKIHSVMFEVTHRCPCDCVHCFLVKDPKGELSLEEITDLFTQLKKEGTINIGISGGEPFLRDDLPRILEEAKRNGFFLSILTTGILVGRAEAILLKKLNVFNAEISMLGSTAETHDGIMNRPGAFNRMIKAVGHLKAEGINVIMKSTLLKQNYRELDDMAALCKSLDVPFEANLFLSPMMDGNTAPQEFMLDGDELSGLNRKHINGGLIPGEDMGGGAILTCNAGKTSAGISPRGDIYPCILMRKKIGSIRERTLQDIWHDNPDTFLSELRALKPEDVRQCATCDLKPLCRRCPGTAYLETGSLAKAAPGACRCAQGISMGYREPLQ